MAAIATSFANLGPMDHLVTTAATVRPGPFRGGDAAAAKMTFEGRASEWPPLRRLL